MKRKSDAGKSQGGKQSPKKTEPDEEYERAAAEDEPDEEYERAAAEDELTEPGAVTPQGQAPAEAAGNTPEAQQLFATEDELHQEEPTPPEIPPVPEVTVVADLPPEPENGGGPVMSASSDVDPLGEVGSTLETSDQWDQVGAAVITAAKGFTEIPKSGYNPFYRSKYATPADIDKGTKKALLDAGVLVVNATRPLCYPIVEMHDPETNKTTKQQRVRMAITTTVLHPASGQWLRNTIVIDGKDGGPHAIGSVVQYGMRYNKRALLDLAAADTDDDGNAGQAGRQQQSSSAPTGQDPRRSQPAKQQKAKPALNKRDRADREVLAQEILCRVEGDDDARKQLTIDVTSFTPEPTKEKPNPSPFRGYDDAAKIGSKGMLTWAWKRLRTHETFGDHAFGIEAPDLVADKPEE